MKQVFKIATEPSAEPVTLTDAKLFLRVDWSTEDALITSLISAARRFCEKYTNRVFITQTWDLWQDGFCGTMNHGLSPWWDGTKEGPISLISGGDPVIHLPKPPLQSVTSVVTYDLSNAQTTVDPSTYFLDAASEPGRIILNYGQIWPVNLRPMHSVNVRFVAGYGDTAAALPDTLIEATRMMIAHYYENRELVADLKLTEAPLMVQSVLNPYRILKL